MEQEFKTRYWVWQAAVNNENGKISWKGKRLDAVREAMRQDMNGVIVAYMVERDGLSSAVSARALGRQAVSMLVAVKGLTALGYDRDNVIGVFVKDGKIIEATCRLAKDEREAIRLTEGVNQGSMSLDDLTRETSSLNGEIGAPFFKESLPLKRIFRDITLPRLLRETGYEAGPDIVDRLDEALSYGLVGFRTAFTWIFEGAKADYREVTSLAMLLNHASAYLSVVGDMYLASFFCYRWMEVDRYALNELDDEGYSYYYKITN